MKSLLIVLLTIVTTVMHGATTPQDNERLRELAVVPTLKLTFNFYVETTTSPEDFTEEGTKEDRIKQARTWLKREPNDLRAQLRLAYLLAANGETNAARVVYEKAATLGRKRMKQQPNDGLNLTLLAEAVWQLDKIVEAENLYRRATSVASTNWYCWSELGEFLRIQSYNGFESLFNDHYATSNAQKLALAFSSEKFDEADKLCREASTCFQRAYEIAPQEFEVLVNYGMYRACSNWQAVLVQKIRTGNVPTPEESMLDMYRIMSSPIARQDFEKALAVRPQAYGMMTTLAFAEFMPAFKEAQRSGRSRPTLEELPEESRQAIVGYMQRLETLAAGPDKKVAAAALASLCTIKMVFDDSQNLVSELQRAVEYDSTNEQAWNMLIGMAAKRVTPEKLTEFCEQRLKAKKSAGNHLVLAKALYNENRFKEAAKHTDAAIKLEPNYVPAYLMRGAILIRLYNGKKDKRELASTFAKTRELIKKSLDDESREWWLVSALNTAISNAIWGNHKNAKAWLDMCQKEFPDDPRVKEIQSAMPLETP